MRSPGFVLCLGEVQLDFPEDHSTARTVARVFAASQVAAAMIATSEARTEGGASQRLPARRPGPGVKLSRHPLKDHMGWTDAEVARLRVELDALKKR